jgi:ribosomal protein S18 acetylase RimI-like enzyme
MVEAREANGIDIGPLADSLARAFHDDPAMIWLFGDRFEPRLRRLRRYFRLEARRHRRHGRVLTGDGQPGAAFWDPPDRWRSSWPALLRSLPVMVPALGPRLRRTLRGLEQVERAHPREPHWYLAVLGTDPDHRGRGIGRSLVDPVLDRCDAEGLGAYLESSKERNIPYYERFGFGVTGQIDLPDGPPLWPMWRDPR